MISNQPQLHTDQNHNITVTYSDQTTINVYSCQLHYAGLDLFKGWHCYAGVNRIFVRPDQSAWSGECQNTYLGNLKDNSFKLLDQPSICNKDTCTGNPDDIETKKYAP